MQHGALNTHVQVEIWSDVVCPWCYIGKRRFEAALAEFEHRDDVEVVWRSFELDRHAPVERIGSYAEMLGRKYGMGPTQAHAALDNMTAAGAREDLAFDFERVRPGNTFDAHRLLHLAARRGVQDALKERLLLAYFTEGRPVGDRDEITRLAREVGLDETEIEAVLRDGTYGDEVRADESAAEELGISGVPFFLFDRRYAVSGAQQAETFERALERAWSDRRRLEFVAAGPDAAVSVDGSRDDGSCAI